MFFNINCKIVITFKSEPTQMYSIFSLTDPNSVQNISKDKLVKLLENSCKVSRDLTPRTTGKKSLS